MSAEKSVKKTSHRAQTRSIRKNDFTVIGSWRWEAIHTGACHQVAGGTLQLFSDGNGLWFAQYWSQGSDSGDAWHASFEFFDAEGNSLHKSGSHISPDISHDEAAPSSWLQQYRPLCPPELVKDIAYVTEYSEC